MNKFTTGLKAGVFALSLVGTAQAQMMQLGSKITDSAAAGYDQFGYGVAIDGSGETIAAGTPYAGTNTAPYKGRGHVLIYNHTDTGYRKTGILYESMIPDSSSYFGKHLAFSANGNVLLVSGHGSASMKGAVYIYRKASNGGYQFEQKLSGPVKSSYFGDALAISGDGNTVVVGIPRLNSQIGAIAIYKYANNTWVQDSTNLTPSDVTGSAYFGSAVSVSHNGSTIVVGGPSNKSYYGAVWVCSKANNTWSFSSVIEPKSSGNYAGKYVAVDSTGAHFFTSDGKGFWEYELQNGSYAAIGNKVNAAGEAMAIVKNTFGKVLIGAATNANPGGIKVFTRSAGSWQQTDGISGTGNTGNARQGTNDNVAVNGDGSLAVLGAIGDNGSRGAVWTFASTDSVVVTTQGNVPAVINTYGDSLQLTATLFPQHFSQDVVWTIAPGTGTATISATGMVIAQTNGTITATATSVFNPATSGQIVITLSNQYAPVDSVVVATLNNVPAVINTDKGTLNVVATVFPATTNPYVHWSIVPVTGTATVSVSGVMTAVTNGTVWAKAISMQDSSKADSILVTISNQIIEVDSVVVGTMNNVAPLINTYKGTVQMMAVVYPANANQAVIWTIDPANGVATVSAAGLITAQADGTVWAKAISVQDSLKMDSVQVTIIDQATGIKDASNKIALLTYPNPASHSITLQIAGHHPALQLVMTNAYGSTVVKREIAANELNQPMVIDIDGLMEGVYIISLLGEGVQVRNKIIKQ